MVKEIQILNNGEPLYDIRRKINENFEAVQENVLTKQQITNCLLEVPQRIKLELNNGALTLKAGSRVIIPNGFEADGITPKFDYHVVPNDLVKAFTADTGAIICYTKGSPWEPSGEYTFDYFTNGYNLFSGSTKPTVSNLHVFWYDTTVNKIKASQDAGATWSEVHSSLPLCMINSNTAGTMVSIEQVFSAYGYIGSTIWVDRGVRGLAPNGRNEDGSLENIDWTAPDITVLTNSIDTSHSKAVIAYNPNEPVGGHKIGVISTESFNYNNSENRNYDLDSEWAYTPIATATIINGVITAFDQKLTFRAAENQDLVKVYNFKTTDWTFDSNLDLYVLNTGQIHKVGVNVFKKTDLGGVTVEFVDIIENSKGILTLHALAGFDGYVIFA